MNCIKNIAKAEVLKLIGYSVSQISRIINIPRQTVDDWSKMNFSIERKKGSGRKSKTKKELTGE